MTKLNTELQNDFLERMRSAEVPVTLFLVNGVKLQGLIESVDDQCILLKRDGHVQLVYKQALSTVMPQGPVADFTTKK